MRLRENGGEWDDPYELDYDLTGRVLVSSRTWVGLPQIWEAVTGLL